MTSIDNLSSIEAAERLADMSPQTKARFDEWKAQDWEENEAPYGAFRAIGAAVASKRNPLSAKELEVLFAFAERLLKQGGGDVSNMVATCMLEANWTAAHESGFDFSVVNRHLGPEARAYLLAWDEFNRTTTIGLTRR